MECGKTTLAIIKCKSDSMLLSVENVGGVSGITQYLYLFVYGIKIKSASFEVHFKRHFKNDFFKYVKTSKMKSNFT